MNETSQTATNKIIHFKNLKKMENIKTTSEPIVVEQTFNAPVEKVWSAITRKDEMKQWYFLLTEFKPEVGFGFQFYGGTETKQYLHSCIITEVIPNKKISYTWKYDGYAGNSLVTFELFPEENQTSLKLTHEGLETFPSDNPDFARHNFVEGWNQIIKTSLKDYLEKK